MSGAVKTLTAPGVTTITESALPAGYTLASINCSGLAGGSQATDLPTRTVTLDTTSTAANSAIACTFTNTFAASTAPTVQLTKISIGGVGNFSFTGSNGFASDSITTVTPGVGVAGAVRTLAASGASTVITESAMPAGYTLRAISCSGLGAGGTATPNLGAGTVTLNTAATAAGAAIACTFTNTSAAMAAPTVQVTKISNGGVNSFAFTGSNGIASHAITTTTAGTGVTGTLQTLTTAGVITTITESAPPAGYNLASISCSGLGTGGTATPSLGTRTVTLNAAATAAGSAIACTFTNNLAGAPSVASIPTLSEWAMILLMALMAFLGMQAVRKQRR